MNIYFIYPLVNRRKGIDLRSHEPFPPLSLVYIATVLKQNGHNVKIGDRNTLLIKNNYDFDLTDKEVLEEIRSFRPQIVGFSATTPLMSDVIYFSKEVKKAFPAVINIIGGVHPTVVPEETLAACPDIDLLVEGEGEMTMLDIANRFPDFDLPGVWRRKGKDFCTAGKRGVIEDLDTIPVPDRSLLDMDFYTRSFQMRRFFGRHTSIFSSRGCYKRCHFCAGPLMFPGKVRYHSAERTVEEMEKVAEIYNVNHITFADDMFLAGAERAEAICEKIKKRRLHKRVKWICQIRADSAKLKILKLMKSAGCVMVECGFESGSQEELRRMNKNVDIKKYYEFADIVRKTGLTVRANMITNYLDQTEKDLMLSANFIKTVKPYYSIFHHFWALPGTYAYKELLKRNCKISWENCTNPGQNFSKMSAERHAELSAHIRTEIVDPLNRKNFIKYNIRRHPLLLCRFFFKMNFKKKIKVLFSYIFPNKPRGITMKEANLLSGPQ